MVRIQSETLVDFSTNFEYINLKKQNMKNTIAILMLAGLLTTACSTNETPTTEPTTESVDSLYQDTIELGGSVDTTAAAQ